MVSTTDVFGSTILSFLLEAVKETHRTGRRLKGQSLQDGSWLFGWKFFQTQWQGLEKAGEAPLSTYVVVYLIQSSDTVQMPMLCSDLG
ncbi:hypothetical protein TNCV_3803531 [Trichonephila clavipes]|nr:hypothetical protein TNCV_3803531 [Trichonephila clavipes]